MDFSGRVVNSNPGLATYFDRGFYLPTAESCMTGFSFRWKYANTLNWQPAQEACDMMTDCHDTTVKFLKAMLNPLSCDEPKYMLFWKHCRTTSAGFWWSNLIRIHTASTLIKSTELQLEYCSVVHKICSMIRGKPKHNTNKNNILTYNVCYTVKPVLSGHKKKTKNGFHDRLLLNVGKKIAECS